MSKNNPFEAQALANEQNKEFLKPISLEISPTYKSVGNSTQNNKIEFWSFNDDKVLIDEIKLIEFIENNGVIRQSNGSSKYFRVKDGIVEEVNHIQIKDLVVDFLKREKETKVFSAVHKKSESLFSKSKLTTIDKKEISYIKDTKDKCHIFYKNGVVEVSKDKVQLVPYSHYINKGLVIDREHKLNRNFKVNNERGMFEEMVANVSSHRTAEDSNDEKNEHGYYFRKSDFESKALSLGYLIHRYKDPSISKCVVAIDYNIDMDETNGRTGKSLFMTSLKHIRHLKSFDGKLIKINKDKFSLQGLSKEHQFILIDDVAKNFNFEEFFHIISSELNVEKKYEDRVSIDYKDSPKMAITSNYPLKGDGASYSGRQHIIEFSDFYNEERNPKSIHGMNFFEGWNESEWNKFDTFMIKCVQTYLEVGELKKARKSNYELYKSFAKLGESATIFIEWAETLPLDKKMNRKELLDGFNASNPKNTMKSRTFYKTLKSFINAKGYLYNAHKDGKDEKDRKGNRYITLSMNGDQN